MALRTPALVRQGGKTYHAKTILNYIEETSDKKTLVDVFGGGGSISLEAENRGYDVIYNDIDPLIYTLFSELMQASHLSIATKKLLLYPNKKRFTQALNKGCKSYEDYLILYCWSFNNQCKNFLYTNEKLPDMLELTRIIMGVAEKSDKYNELCEIMKNCCAESVSERHDYYLKYGKRCKNVGFVKYRKGVPGMAAKRINHLEVLKKIERLANIKTNKIKTFNLDYKNLSIPPDAVVFLDPPYLNTLGYGIEFNYDDFVEWYLSLPNENIYITEYTQPPHTKEILTLGKLSNIMNRKRNKVSRLYKVIK